MSRRQQPQRERLNAMTYREKHELGIGRGMCCWCLGWIVCRQQDVDRSHSGSSLRTYLVKRLGQGPKQLPDYVHATKVVLWETPKCCAVAEVASRAYAVPERELLVSQYSFRA